MYLTEFHLLSITLCKLILFVFRQPVFVTYLCYVFRVCGGELFDFVAEHRQLSESQTVHIVRQILEAVQHMHFRHIAHLDLKVRNKLVSCKSLNF